MDNDQLIEHIMNEHLIDYDNFDEKFYNTKVTYNHKRVKNIPQDDKKKKRNNEKDKSIREKVDKNIDKNCTVKNKVLVNQIEQEKKEKAKRSLNN